MCHANIEKPKTTNDEKNRNYQTKKKKSEVREKETSMYLGIL